MGVQKLSRRKLVESLAAATLAGLSGCSTPSDSSGSKTTTATSTAHPTTPEGALTVWQNAFNDGNTDTLRSIYSEHPENHFMWGGNPPPGIEPVLSFNTFMSRRNATIIQSNLEITEESSEAITVQGDVLLSIDPWSDLEGTVQAELNPVNDEYRVKSVTISHSQETIVSHVFGPMPSRDLEPGVKPLVDMKPDETYHGEKGGLYGEYENSPPQEHRKRAVIALDEIEPLDENGNPDQDGAIGFLSHGMSFCEMYFETFNAQAQNDQQKSPYVVPINGASGGLEYSTRSLGLGGYPLDAFLNRITEKIKDITPEQIQVAWLQPTHFPYPPELTEPMLYAENLQSYLTEGILNLDSIFPNLKIIYLSDRPYQGFGEQYIVPLGYEVGFAVRNTILDQIEGNSGIASDNIPVLLWGPYLWTNGESPRDDGFTWKADYFGEQAIHPSQSGRERFAELFVEFLHTNELAKPWYTRAQTA